MQSSELKTSWKQRIFIGLIAIILLFSTIAVYALIVVNNEAKNGSSSSSDSELADIYQQLTEAQSELDEVAKPLSDKYLKTMKSYRSRVKAYNAEKVNSGGLKTTDIKKGDGKKLEAYSTEYMAYYIGWCADETVFDSSFDDFDDPAKLSAPLIGGSMIEGWEQGIAGMKIGGVRELTIPGELAYGETQEICGTTNSPLKFIVMTLKKDSKVDELYAEINNLQTQYYALAQGVQY